MMTADALGFAQSVLDAQPFSRLLGAELTLFSSGRATLELDIRPDLLQQNGFLHGGVIAYAADNALTFAAGSALGPEVLTGGFTINYLRPAEGHRLSARAELVQAGKRQAVCRCDVFALPAAAGTAVLCATALGTVLRTGAS